MTRHFLVVFIVLATSTFAQKSALHNICFSEKVLSVNNDSIKYLIGLAACEKCAPIHSVGFRVSVVLSEAEFSAAKKINRTCWLLLLENEKTDWAANLILYDLKDKEAIPLLHKDITSWRKYTKQEDVEYWKKTLK